MAAVLAVDQSFLFQCLTHAFVQAFHTPGAAPQGAQQLEVAVGFEHFSGPVVEGRLIGVVRRALLGHDREKVTIADRRRSAGGGGTCLGLGKAFGIAGHREAGQAAFVVLGQLQVREVGEAGAESLLNRPALRAGSFSRSSGALMAAASWPMPLSAVKRWLTRSMAMLWSSGWPSASR